MMDSRGNKLRLVAIRFSVAVITFAIGIAANAAWTALTAVPTPPTPQQHPVEIDYDSAEIGTLRRQILEAKARGENTLELSVLGCGWDIGSLQTSLSRDTVVLADVVGKKTYEDTYGLHTWYRFKTKETLVDHPHPLLASTFANAPTDMLPIAEDEFLIYESNGRMVIDGVAVTQHSNGVWYHEDQTYLLFLWIEPSKQTAIRAGTDPLGVFLVDADENLRPYLDEPYSFSEQIARRFKNSVVNMRQALKK